MFTVAKFSTYFSTVSTTCDCGGLSLEAMETIGDFGTVSQIAVNTLTTAVYDTWLGYSNLNAAAKSRPL